MVLVQNPNRLALITMNIHLFALFTICCTCVSHVNRLLR